MDKSIGIAEYRSIAIGIGAVDIIVKAADVKLVDAKSICPGKYYIMFTGSVDAVKNSMERAISETGDFLVDNAVIPNIYPEIFAAINQTSQIGQLKAIGVVETLTSPSIMIAADAAIKATAVELVEIRIARALGGKNTYIINGDVSSVKESVLSSIEYPESKGFLVDYQIIPSPHKDFYRAIL
jgi:microcompartment protein CcmL/EutN